MRDSIHDTVARRRRVETGQLLIERCIAEADFPALVEAFHLAVAEFGFDACAAGAWTGMGRNRVHRFYFNSWPADWLALYGERNMFPDDPVILQAQRSMSPFLWRDLVQPAGSSFDVLELALEYGWKDGLVVRCMGHPIVTTAIKR